MTRPSRGRSGQSERAAQPFKAADGQIVLNGRRKVTIVSAATTTSDDEELRDALARLAAARYGREPRFDGRLDDSIEATLRAADRLLAARPALERAWAR